MSQKQLTAFLPLIIFGGLIVAFFIGTRLNPSTLESALIDKPLSEFELASVYEDQPNVTKDVFDGKISLINVFGSWCVACTVEHPYLVKLSRTEDIQIIGLNWRDDRSKALAWLQKYRDPYDAIAFDTDSELAIELGVTGAPETYLVDQNGIIRLKHVGMIDDTVWREVFRPAIAALKSSP